MTRMWMTPPEEMCRQHLLGEHKELHQLLGHLRLGRQIKKYAEYQLVEPLSLHQRHEQLALEMKRRGYNHKSPMDAAEALVVLKHLPDNHILTKIDTEASKRELVRRCVSCAERVAKATQDPALQSREGENDE